MAEQTVELALGESKVVSFEAIPNKVKTYQVSVDGLTGSFVATAPPPPEFAYISPIRQIPYTQDPGTPWAKAYFRVEVDVQNVGDVAGICNCVAQARCWDTNPDSPYYGGWGPWTNFVNLEVAAAVLQPGEIVTFSAYQIRASAYGHTCQVRFTGDPGTTPEASMI